MNETDIRKYAQLMKELELTGLEITEDDKMVRLERSATVPAATPVPPIPAAVSVPASASEAELPACQTSIKSPLVGVFYASPAENASPYVETGSRIKKGQTLCIIEAMKLMNEITAEEDGTVLQICVTNGQVVEYGTELFRIGR